MKWLESQAPDLKADLKVLDGIRPSALPFVHPPGKRQQHSEKNQKRNYGDRRHWENLVAYVVSGCSRTKARAVIFASSCLSRHRVVVPSWLRGPKACLAEVRH